MFKVGDIVEITDCSDATGMLDFKKGKGYEVINRHSHQEILLRDEGGHADWYHYAHFKPKKEDAMEDGVKFKIGDTLVCTETNPVGLSANSITTGEEYVVTGLWEEGIRIVSDDGEEVGVCDYRFKLKEDAIVEKKECLFKEGQVVWDLRSGRGVVEEITNCERYPVKVRFDLKDMDGCAITDHYMMDGRYAATQTIRSLYFSEPKIEAATEPLFEPTLKKGDKVVVKFEDGSVSACIVKEELEDRILTECSDWIYKHDTEIFRLGEKINFK